ncbi:sigma-70 family RNA polymerase sigma factor [Kitasatospora sp. NPDC090091]|uniref:sigma-70 family RNA polymerase sigma factor n=1 Tax=Kitasatospora sp. NPDC090091 TaxID=3364081 RepID=UPI003811026E
MSALTTAFRVDLTDLTDPELAALLREPTTTRGPAVHDVMGEVFARHHAAVLAYARTCCRDAATAHDLAAEAFARTCRAVAAGAGPQYAWRPYLLTCVRHAAMDWAREGARTQLSDDFESWVDTLPAGQDVEGAVLAAEEGSLVLRAYRSLPERWQAVLWHAVVEREPAAVTARRLGMTAGGIGSLVARAREGLREAYLRAHLDQTVSEECRHYGGLLAASVRRPGKRAGHDLGRHLRSCADCARAEGDLRDLNGRLGAILPAGILLWSPHTLWASAAGHGLQLTAAKLAAAKLGAARLGTAKAAWTAAAVAGATVAAVGIVPQVGAAPDRAAAPPAATPTQVPARQDPPVPASPAVSAAPAVTATPAAPSASPSAAPSASPSAAPSVSAQPAGSRAMVNAMTGLCAQADPGGALSQRGCDRSAGQTWILLPAGGNARIKNAGTGRCLGSGGSAADGAPLVQEDCATGSKGQVWTLCDNGMVINAANGLLIGLKHWPKADRPGPGDQLTQSRNYYDSQAFRWQQRPLGAGA